MHLFLVQLTIAGETHLIGYNSIDDCLRDAPLSAVLDDDRAAECIIFCGELRLTGTPIKSSEDLHRALASNAHVILRRVL